MLALFRVPLGDTIRRSGFGWVPRLFSQAFGPPVGLSGQRPRLCRSATIENPAKKAKYLKTFTLYVDGNEVYAKESADVLESDLQPLVGGEMVTRMSKHDTNPANNPQPPERYRR